MGKIRNLRQWRKIADLWPGDPAIAIIRCNAQHPNHLRSFIRAAGFQPFDIDSWDQVALGSVLDGGVSDCALRGKPIQSFAAVIFSGSPDVNDLNDEVNTVDKAFIKRERDQAMLAALASSARLINRGYWIDFHRVLSRQEAQLRALSAIGWQTPCANWTYDFESHQATKMRVPEPANPVLITLTQRKHIVHPETRVSKSCLHMIRRTQYFMSTQSLDWCVVAASFYEQFEVAYGLSPELPDCLPVTLAAELINDAVGASSA